MQNLQPFHTFAVPVSAQKIIEIQSVSALKQVWAEAQAQHLPVLFLGQGSNVLFLEDFTGWVLLNRLRGIEYRQDPDFHFLHIQGGENWHQLICWCLEQGIAGLENLALIPGCVGSAPIQNIGAYGVEFKDVCEYVEVLNLNTGEQFRLSNAECQFGYRDSVFKRQYAQGYVVVAVGLKLAKQWQPVLKYAGLAQLESETKPLTPQGLFNEICRIRNSKLPDPKQFGNAGSFFKNPVVGAEKFAQLKRDYPNIPAFPQTNGEVKLAAAWLIDQAGLKGAQIGGAAVHQQQPLALINRGQASAEDIRALAQKVRETVWHKFGVEIEPEVRFIAAKGEVNALQAISISSAKSMTFNEILNGLPPIDGLLELKVQDDNQQIVHRIPAVEGKLGSLRVYYALAKKYQAQLNALSAQQGIDWFAEHSADARQHQGKHPNIDFLFQVIEKGLNYQLIAIFK